MRFQEKLNAVAVAIDEALAAADAFEEVWDDIPDKIKANLLHRVSHWRDCRLHELIDELRLHRQLIGNEDVQRDARNYDSFIAAQSGNA